MATKWRVVLDTPNFFSHQLLSDQETSNKKLLPARKELQNHIHFSILYLSAP